PRLSLPSFVLPPKKVVLDGSASDFVHGSAGSLFGQLFEPGQKFERSFGGGICRLGLKQLPLPSLWPNWRQYHFCDSLRYQLALPDKLWAWRMVARNLAAPKRAGCRAPGDRCGGRKSA